MSCALVFSFNIIWTKWSTIQGVILIKKKNNNNYEYDYFLNRMTQTVNTMEPR